MSFIETQPCQQLTPKDDAGISPIDFSLKEIKNAFQLGVTQSWMYQYFQHLFVFWTRLQPDLKACVQLGMD